MNMVNSRTCIYLEAPGTLSFEMQEHASELLALGFHVVSTWHRPTAAARVPRLHTELGIMAKADVMLVFPSGGGDSLWIKVGWAAALGLKIICVGGAGLPECIRDFFVLRVETWGDLERNHFLKLGSARYRRPTR